MALSDGLFFSNQLDTPGWDSAVFGDLVTRVFAAAAVPRASQLLSRPRLPGGRRLRCRQKPLPISL